MTDEERRQRIRESLNLSDQVDSPLLYKVKKEKNPLRDWIFFGLLLGVVILFNSLFAIVRVDGKSMDPTLSNNQIMLLSRTEKVKRFDIAVFTERTETNGESKQIVKRVIGMPGDTVTVLNGELYINNEKYEEPYLSKNNIKNWSTTSFTIKVPDGYYFVLGDNRDISKDSRQVGSFIKTSVVGVKMFN